MYPVDNTEGSVFVMFAEFAMFALFASHAHTRPDRLPVRKKDHGKDTWRYIQLPYLLSCVQPATGVRPASGYIADFLFIITVRP